MDEIERELLAQLRRELVGMQRTVSIYILALDCADDDRPLPSDLKVAIQRLLAAGSRAEMGHNLGWAAHFVTKNLFRPPDDLRRRIEDWEKRGEAVEDSTKPRSR